MSTHLISSKTYEIGAIIILMAQVKKMRHREAKKSHFQGHTVRNKQVGTQWELHECLFAWRHFYLMF